MTTLSLTDKDFTEGDVLVVMTVKHAKGVRLADPQGLSAEFVKAANATLALLEAKGGEDEIVRIAGLRGHESTLVLAVGSGAQQQDTLESPAVLRRAGGAAARALTGTERATFAFPATTPEAIGALAEGILLGAYTYGEYQSTPKTPLGTAVIITAAAKESAVKEAVTTANAVSAAQNWARDLVNMPPLDLYPASFAEIVRKRFSGSKVKVSIMDEKALAKADCGGLIGVGRGSARPPRLVTLQYKPSGATKHVAIVGKGITFDSGGLCIKPANGMVTMKCDMAGAAAVAAFIDAAAALELPVQITGYLCLAENMTGADAQRPGDVIRMHDGTTVEIDNTDAEGRLVMADGLCYASQEKPDLVIDIATLTGAAVLALGHRTAAIVGNNDRVRDDLIDASARVDEHMWPMPLLDHLRPSIESDIADLKHTGERMGGLITAAMFLKEFVGEGDDGQQLDWIHMDIAAPAFNEGSAHGFTPKGGTGFAVRTLVELARA